MMIRLFRILLAMIAIQLLTPVNALDEARFTSMVEKLESDVVELSQKVEELYRSRCELTLLADCINGNYDHCLSSYPDETCPGGDDLNAPECGDGITCAALVSFAASTVSLPREVADGPGKNPTDPLVVETVCYTKAMDDFLIGKRTQDAPFWKEFGTQPNYGYFGSTNGAFRIFPATYFNCSCNDYDPRVRPWYVAASSGPKNIIMVLDQSGSMLENNKIGILKQAAKRVVETSTVGDRIAVVAFNGNATQITDQGYLFVGTEESRETLVKEIDKIEAFGGTNYYDAFEAAFNILDRSIAEEVNVNCNTAIIFLTDGVMTLPLDKNEQDVIDLVERRLNATSETIDEPIYLFTYSVSGGDPKIEGFPKQLACSTGTGVWTKIEYEEDIVDSLSNYYRFFTLGLGSGSNEDFTAWLEPYLYDPGDTLGTTVAAPVYDRTTEPNLFLGVVGIDMTLEALDKALGITNGDSSESFRRVVQRSTAKCPRLTLSTCELESFRRQGLAGDEALCHDACSNSDFVQIESKKCPSISDYPRDLWANRDYEDVPFLDKACCRVGETTPDKTCYAPDSGKSTALVAGAACGAAVAVALVLLFLAWFQRRKRKERAADTADEDCRPSGRELNAADAAQDDSPSTPQVASALAHPLGYKDQCRPSPRPTSMNADVPFVVPIVLDGENARGPELRKRLEV